MGWKQRIVERPDGSLLQVDSWRPGAAAGAAGQLIGWAGWIVVGAAIALALRALHAAGVTP
jgi:hypothetical protein